MSRRKALIIVDVINDFMEGGVVGVKGADEDFALKIYIESIRPNQRLIPKFFVYDLTVAVLEGHPGTHCSFKKYGRHGIMGLPGSEPAFNTTGIQMILRKGTLPYVDSTSAFLSHPWRGKRILTGLHGFLQERGVTDIDVCGLEFSVCIADTAIDGAGLGYRTRVLKKLTRSWKPETDEEVIVKLRKAGVKIVL